MLDVAFGVSAAVSGSIPLVYDDWMSLDWTSTGYPIHLILHLTTAVALGIAIGIAKSDFQRLIARVGRRLKRK